MTFFSFQGFLHLIKYLEDIFCVFQFVENFVNISIFLASFKFLLTPLEFTTFMHSIPNINKQQSVL